MRSTAIFLLPTTFAFQSSFHHAPCQTEAIRRATTALNLVGIFYGTSTGSTEEAAQLIAQEFGQDAAGPFDIDSIQGKVGAEFGKFDALVVSLRIHSICDGILRRSISSNKVSYYLHSVGGDPHLEHRRRYRTFWYGMG